MNSSTLTPPMPASQPRLTLRKAAAVGLGNALEFYDFLCFSFFAVQIGHTFFPVTLTSRGLLLTLATFGVGFVTRPLGGLVIGAYGDRAGRKAAMVVSFTLMGTTVLGQALIPSFARIGLAAPLLLLGFRLLQGFALGGEVGPSTAYLVEAAPPSQRGRYVAVQLATQGLAILAAGIVGVALSAALRPATLDAWGWRIAFLLGAAVVPVGLSLRRRLTETLAESERRGASCAHDRLRLRQLLLGILIIAPAAVATYVLSYMATYAQDSLRLATHAAFPTTIIIGVCATCGAPLAGLLADRVGRKPVFLLAVGALVALVVPCYLLINRLPSVTTLYAVTALLSSLTIFVSVSALVSVCESLPKAARSGALGSVYALAAALFGGTTQFAVKWLIDATANPLAPAWYLTAALLIGGLAMLATRESAPRDGGAGAAGR